MNTEYGEAKVQEDYYDINRPNLATDAYVKKLRLLQTQCDGRRTAADRLAAHDELQDALGREQWKFERAADEEEKLRLEAEEEKKRHVVNNKFITIGEMERVLESFVFDQKVGTARSVRDFSLLFKNFLRSRHGLPNL